MKKEMIQYRFKETAAKIQNTKIDAIRMKDIVKKGVRVYDNGCIGIAGGLGDVSEEELTAKAVENLAIEIPYAFDLEAPHAEKRLLNPNPLPAKVMFEHAEGILKVLKDEFPMFDFSEKISTAEFEVQYTSSEGTDLLYQDAYFELGLVLKEKASANLFDGFIGYKGRQFDQDQFLAFNRSFLEAYNTKVDLPAEGKMPVFFAEFHELNRFLSMMVNGEKYANGASLFSGKLGETLFNDKLNVVYNLNSETAFRAFFDQEGARLPNDELPLIQKGQLLNVYADKRTAKNFDLPHTAAASGEYDGVPSLAITPLHFHTDSKDIKTALAGRPALFVLVAAGGDFTPDGGYASPVQVGFLFDGEKIIGKVPECQIRGHLNQLLGSDYIGTFDNPFYFGDYGQLQGFEMDVQKA